MHFVRFGVAFMLSGAFTPLVGFAQQASVDAATVDDVNGKCYVRTHVPIDWSEWIDDEAAPVNVVPTDTAKTASNRLPPSAKFSTPPSPEGQRPLEMNAGVKSNEDIRCASGSATVHYVVSGKQRVFTENTWAMVGSSSSPEHETNGRKRVGRVASLPPENQMMEDLYRGKFEVKQEPPINDYAPPDKVFP